MSSETIVRFAKGLPAGQASAPEPTTHARKPGGAAPAHTAEAPESGTSHHRTRLLATCVTSPVTVLEQAPLVGTTCAAAKDGVAPLVESEPQIPLSTVVEVLEVMHAAALAPIEI